MADALDALLAESRPQRDALDDLVAAQTQPKSAPKGGSFVDTLMGFGQGATMGLMPHLRAGMMTGAGLLGLPGQSSEYGQNLNVARIMEQQAQENSPAGYGAGQVAGAVGSGLTGALGATRAATAAGLNPLAASLGGSFVTGTGQGAVQGATAAPVGQEAEGATSGALTGALWSAAGGTVAGLSKLVGAPKAISAISERVKAADVGDKIEREAFAQFFGAKSYTAARKMAMDQLKTEAAEAAAKRGGLVKAGEIAGLSALGAYGAQQAGQSPILGAIGGAVGGKQTGGKLTEAMRAVAPAAPVLSAGAAAATNQALMPRPDSQPVLGLDALLTRLRSAWTD